MTNILFILFLGNGENIKIWNENTKSKFLDRLKTLGDVYVYQDKSHNIIHYDLSDKKHLEYNNDINFDLSYIKVNNYVKMIYDDINKKYKNYKYIPIGHSGGGLMALYFSQIYYHNCIHCILLDPATIHDIQDIDEKYIIHSNTEFKEILRNIKNYDYDSIIKMENIIWNLRKLFYKKKLKLQLKVPTTSFYNIEKPEHNKGNNNLRLNDIKLMYQYNKKMYESIILINKTHYIFNKIQPAKQIIKYIQNLIKNEG